MNAMRTKETTNTQRSMTEKKMMTKIRGNLLEATIAAIMVVQTTHSMETEIDHKRNIITGDRYLPI